ncbi:glutathione S-transferase T1-like isoform X3 [Prosopis cineraria]|uniref:glutathione S-transferase T1-like isoform X3 n=1 Tax=Prosopis cineraria TaxID=364024 RepID=UPI0024109184|nr:glutathione S-transferase T1-like isoform X3 [Prosopis cineraria]
MVRLKVYADRMSQPSRAVLLFCRLSGIDFDEIKVDISKRQQLSPEFRAMQFLSTLLLLFLELLTIVTYVVNTVLGPALGHPLNPKAATEAEKVLLSSLSKLEDAWLNGDGGFLLGGFQPSIADLSMVCELMQLEVLDEKDRSRILTPYKKVLQWIEDTRTATNPHFDVVHNILFKAKRKFQEQRLREGNSGTKPNKMGGLSKM